MYKLLNKGGSRLAPSHRCSKGSPVSHTVALPSGTSFGIFFWKVVVPSPKIGSIRSYIVKENLIGSAVSEILLYRQTDKDPVNIF